MTWHHGTIGFGRMIVFGMIAHHTLQRPFGSRDDSPPRTIYCSTETQNKREPIDIDDDDDDGKSALTITTPTTTTTTTTTSQPPPGSLTTVVDVGCGTGEFLQRIQDVDITVGAIKEDDVRHFGNEASLFLAANEDEDRSWEAILSHTKFIGIDASPNKLKRAMMKFPIGDDAPPLWIQASAAERLPVDDESVDVICSTNVFHLFDDKTRVLQEMHRVLKPGGEGTIVITDWCADYWLPRLYDALKLVRWSSWSSLGSQL